MSGKGAAAGLAIAAAGYVARDLQRPDGVTRPLLRETAMRLSRSRSIAARRVGEAYLRIDPPSVPVVAAPTREAKALPPAGGSD